MMEDRRQDGGFRRRSTSSSFTSIPSHLSSFTSRPTQGNYVTSSVDVSARDSEARLSSRYLSDAEFGDEMDQVLKEEATTGVRKSGSSDRSSFAIDGPEPPERHIVYISGLADFLCLLVPGTLFVSFIGIFGLDMIAAAHLTVLLSGTYFIFTAVAYFLTYKETAKPLVASTAVLLLTSLCCCFAAMPDEGSLRLFTFAAAGVVMGLAGLCSALQTIVLGDVSVPVVPDNVLSFGSIGQLLGFMLNSYGRRSFRALVPPLLKAAAILIVAAPALYFVAPGYKEANQKRVLFYFWIFIAVLAFLEFILAAIWRRRRAVADEILSLSGKQTKTMQKAALETAFLPQGMDSFGVKAGGCLWLCGIILTACGSSLSPSMEGSGAISFTGGVVILVSIGALAVHLTKATEGQEAIPGLSGRMKALAVVYSIVLLGASHVQIYGAMLSQGCLLKSSGAFFRTSVLHIFLLALGIALTLSCCLSKKERSSPYSSFSRLWVGVLLSCTSTLLSLMVSLLGNSLDEAEDASQCDGRSTESQLTIYIQVLPYMLSIFSQHLSSPASLEMLQTTFPSLDVKNFFGFAYALLQGSGAFLSLSLLSAAQAVSQSVSVPKVFIYFFLLLSSGNAVAFCIFTLWGRHGDMTVRDLAADLEDAGDLSNMERLRNSSIISRSNYVSGGAFDSKKNEGKSSLFRQPSYADGIEPGMTSSTHSRKVDYSYDNEVTPTSYIFHEHSTNWKDSDSHHTVSFKHF